MDENIQTFWHQFCKKHKINENTPVEAWAFGATRKDADELASLVDKGIKTATTSAYELYGKDEKLPKVNESISIVESAIKIRDSNIGE